MNMNMNLRQLALLILLPLVVAGCAAQPAVVQTEPLYCYATLGEEDCHAEPLPGEIGRLVGFAGPAPVDLPGR